MYRSVITLVGIQKDADSKTSGTPLVIAELAIGDGNSTASAPTQAMTGLFNEIARFPIDRIYQDPDDDPTVYTVEATPDEEIEGISNEYALIDSDGDCYIIGAMPQSQLTTAASGVAVGTTFLVKVATSNGAQIALTVGANANFASRAYVDQKVEDARQPGNLIPGGNAGQVLVKNSSQDGDFGWIDQEDIQTQPPSPPDSLLRARNLADLENSGSARSNLGVYSKAQTDQKIEAAKTSMSFPIGGSIYWDMPTLPPGFLLRNGAAISRKTYAKLFAVLGTSYGAGDGVNTFNLPDDRGLFVRVVDGGKGLDPSRSLRSVQDYATAAPRTTSPATINSAGQTIAMERASNPSVVCFVRVSKTGGYVSSLSIKDSEYYSTGGIDPINAVKGDSETRPINRALNFIIKAY